jgi:Type II secretion system (T2SS), protein E, N-terminal domain
MPLLSRQFGWFERAASSHRDRNRDASADPSDGPFRGLAVDPPPGIFRTCANPRCRTGRLQLWRRRETPVFEGGWCCSENCTRARVEAALGREMDGWGNRAEVHQHRIPLGLAMLEQGWITHEDLRKALHAQKTSGAGKLGWWLVRQGSASEELVTRGMGLQWGCPVLDTESAKPEELAVLIPRFFVDAFGALPLRVTAGRILYLGFESSLDPVLALAVERMTGLNVECGLVEEAHFRRAHAGMLEAHFPGAELLEAATGRALAGAFTSAIEQAEPVEARLARVHDCLWLRLWLRSQRGVLPEERSIRDLIGSANSQ